MKNSIVTFLKYAFFLALAGLLFYWVYKDQDFEELFRIVAKADPAWVALSVFFSLVSHYFRAWRWEIALVPSGYHIPKGKGFLAVMVGYLANLAVPRLGEAVRCGSAKNMTGTPFRYSFGAVLSERAVDLVCLGTLVLLVLLIEFERIGSFLSERLSLGREKIIFLFMVLVVGGVSMLGFLFIIYKNRDRLRGHKYYLPIANFLEGLKDGFLSVIKLSRGQFLTYILLSVGIWLMYFLMTYVLFFSLEETRHLSVMCGLTILVMSGIGLIIPTPGGVGSYHLFVSFTLMSYGLSESLGKSFAFLMHSSQTVTIFVFGLISLLISLAISQKQPEIDPELTD